jgi:predicted flap endonuclease-1-like 5' DNA nuclease
LFILSFFKEEGDDMKNEEGLGKGLESQYAHKGIPTPNDITSFH